MNKANIGEKKRIRNDVIFILALVLAVSLLGLGFFLLRGEGDYVTVTVDGRLFAEYPLSEDISVEIRGAENEDHVNHLVIKNGQAFMESATCPDGICVSHRPISRDGESIVCLPNRVVITVHSTEDSNEPDIIA